MENLNAEQIKKALERCVGDTADCNNCPYWVDVDVNCFDNVKSDALALINSQEQRIKELTEENERLRAENEALAISEVKECEISQMLVYRIRDKHPAVMAVISDIVNKMQERFLSLLEKEYKTYTPEGADHYFKNGSYMMWGIAERVFSQVANELLEGV